MDLITTMHGKCELGKTVEDNTERLETLINVIVACNTISRWIIMIGMELGALCHRI